MSFNEENGINSTFPMFPVQKSDRIVISEIVFSKNLVPTKIPLLYYFLNSRYWLVSK